MVPRSLALLEAEAGTFDESRVWPVFKQGGAVENGSQRRAREQAEAALRDLLAAREPTEWKRAGAKATQAAETPTPWVVTKRVASGKPKKLKPKAPAAKTREPKPVKWWLPGCKTMSRAG